MSLMLAQFGYEIWGKTLRISMKLRHTVKCQLLYLESLAKRQIPASAIPRNHLAAYSPCLLTINPIRVITVPRRYNQLYLGSIQQWSRYPKRTGESRAIAKAGWSWALYLTALRTGNKAERTMWQRYCTADQQDGDLPSDLRFLRYRWSEICQ